MSSPEIELSLDEAPAADDIDRLRRGLTEHAAPFVDKPGFVPLAVFAREDGELVAGAHGYICWNWLDVSLLWVASSQRGRGLGSRVLKAFEDAGRDKGCVYAHVNTFSYQAPEFYERHGYEAYAELPDFPPGYRRIYFRKQLG